VTDAPIWIREWAMPNKDTLTIRPIRELVERYIESVPRERGVLSRLGPVVDPFARNCELADITNDRDTATAATHHMDVDDFLAMLQAMLRISGMRPRLVIFDPPYTYNQLRESYKQRLTQAEAHRFGIWTKAKNMIAEMQASGDRVIHMGHHSNGMCKKRGYGIIEGLIVAHGGAHNDTLVIVEEKLPPEHTPNET